MCHKAGDARDLHLSVSGNRLEKGVRDIIKAIADNMTPAYLSIRMIEFIKEDHCKQFLQAVRINKTLRMLDMSKASLPYDASDETCDALRDLFAENNTLEEFDISGEQAHLEVARFGIGLSQALNGLKSNKTLKVLRIEYQNLGLEGANTLSSVLEINNTLTHIYCEHNDMNLQGFTTLVNALANNNSILFVPFMSDDQGESVRNMSASIRDPKKLVTSTTAHQQKDAHHHHGVKSGMLKSLGTFGVSKPPKTEVTPQDLDEFVKVLQERWHMQNERMASFLNRNRDLVYGEQHPDHFGQENQQPNTANEHFMRPMSVVDESEMLQRVLSDTTPKIELLNPVDSLGHRVQGLGIIDDGVEEKENLNMGWGNGNGVNIDAVRALEGHQKHADDRKVYELPTIKRGERMFDLEAEMWDVESDGGSNMLS